MTSTPPPPVDIPPYQVQSLLDKVVETYGITNLHSDEDFDSSGLERL